jgi:hypothetical protein
MAKKQLNVDAIRSELTEGSAFFRDYRKQADSPITPAPRVETPVVQEQHSPIEQVKPAIPERAFGRSYERANARRIITRNSFEVYEDQMDSLRELSYQEKREGRIGSMSAMVREALDNYLKVQAKRQ